MSIVKKGKSIETRYEKIAPVCRGTQRVFKLLAYFAAAMAALLAIMAVVLAFVNVEADELLTPYMKTVVNESGEKMYSLRLSNGIKVLRACDDVNTSNIKRVVYARLFTWMAGLLVAVPVFRSLGRLFENVGKGRVLAPENAVFVNYIGLSVMIGNPLVLLLKRYFNYALIEKFVEEELHFAFGIDVFSFLLGLLLIVIGTIYGYACSLHKKETALVPTEKSH